MSLLTPDDILSPQDAAAGDDDLAAVPYTKFPYIPRRWIQEDYLPVGSPVIYAAAGETGKGLLFCADVARVVLGLPFPNEDQSIRREAGRVVWISGVGEDDPFEDLAPRLRAAIAHAVAEFGLDPELASERGAIGLVLDLSTWQDDSPVTLPRDCPRILAEIKARNKKYEKQGTPLVAMVVADSLSALLSEGYTIDSRQGARKVMAKLSRFARLADVAFPVIHHVTKDGKVAGSPAVLDALRLAFTIERDKVNEDVRVITRHKSNISSAKPLRYVIVVAGPATHVEFVAADDQRAQRVRQAEAGSRRSRLAAVAESEAGPFRVLRRAQRAGQAEPDDPQYVGAPCASREAARAAAGADAGAVLTWHAGTVAGMEAAVLARGDGSRVSYGVFPVPAKS